MINIVKEPCTALFSGPTGCGKTQLVLDLLENECKMMFENIIIICSTLRWNQTYRNRSWIWNDDQIFCIEPKSRLYELIEFLSKSHAGEETLFIIDDIIADSSLDKKRQPLLELAISGRHKKHSLWLLTQSYTAVPKNLRRQKKMLFCWYPHEKSDMKLIDEETNLIDNWQSVKDDLKKSKHTCLYIRLEHPHSYNVI